MAAWLNPDPDQPMSLGSHLGELRRRIVPPVVVLALGFILGFAYHAQLKLAIIWPLQRAIELVGPEVAARLRLPTDGTARLFMVTDLAESAINAATLSMYAALALAIPVILWELWQFIAVGLKPAERRLAFLFVPAAVLFFYGGMLLGYFLGIPYMYAWLIQFTDSDPTVVIQLKQADYIDSFFNWTIAFGLIMDIPWAVMVLVRTGLMKPDQLAKARRWVVMVNLVLAAMLTPGSDLASLLALAVPMQLLFELGLIASRFMVPKRSTDQER
jgi:sec-independent protein translocase protein TatC